MIERLTQQVENQKKNEKQTLEWTKMHYENQMKEVTAKLNLELDLLKNHLIEEKQKAEIKEKTMM